MLTRQRLKRFYDGSLFYQLSQTPACTEATPAEKHLSQRLLMVEEADEHFWQACVGGPWSSCQRDCDKATSRRSHSVFGHETVLPASRG